MSTENTTNNCPNLPLHYVEQIALNKSGIACLGQRVGRTETDIRERYTKEEVDRMLDGKADRCALEKHWIDPCAHRKDCRPGGCGRPPVCDCDCYSKAEIHALLENYTNIIKPTNYDLELADGYIKRNASNFWKNQEGLVTVSFHISQRDGYFTVGEHLIAHLPDGFQPITYSAHGCGYIDMVGGGRCGMPMYVTGVGICVHITAEATSALGTISFYAQ